MQTPLVKLVITELVVKWCLLFLVVMVVGEVAALTGPHVCVEKQKYNITKRVKYRAPMSVRTYEWCLAMPPRCSRWTTEMRDLTKLETEERTADVEVCCPGYKIKDISCVPICPYGKTGSHCRLDCPLSKWGPNCVFDCKPCQAPSACSPTTGKCVCHDGWQGESCEIRMSTTTTTTTTTTTQKPEILTTQTNTPVTTTVDKTTVSSDPETDTSPTKFAISYGSIATEIISPHEGTSQSPIIRTVNETSSTLAPESSKTTDMKTSTTSTIVISTTEQPSTMLPQGTKLTSSDTLYYKVPILTATSQSPPTIRLINTTPSTEATKSSKSQTPSTKQMTETTKVETTRKSEATSRYVPTTTKFKPKEIWIRPATKGELQTETRIKSDTHSRHRNGTKKEINIITTPRTIVVSIIPTSVAYSLHKKLSSTYHTSHLLATNRNALPAVTESLSTSSSTSSPPLIRLSSTDSSAIRSSTAENENKTSQTLNTFFLVENRTNSMSTGYHNYSTSLTTAPSVLTTNISNPNEPKTTANTILTSADTTVLKLVTTQRSQIEKTTKGVNVENANNLTQNYTNKGNVATNTRTTQSEEVFPILTEPEHITAIATDKAQERTSVDLLSVLSIAGGVMFAIITVAVVIVMIERCRKPGYEDVRKMDNSRMKVLMDEEDLPPPYVRSIFHTPLPEPPVGEKCHYQPLSTLDRNLKQFMRPVVVQTISPIMIENFRGILECHYDHLPRRSHALDSSQCDLRCSLAPSMSSATEPLCSRATSMIDASKCEAKLDEIDSTTSEPLYAEIPAWRPPSEHAIEVMNINGEACTEL